MNRPSLLLVPALLALLAGCAATPDAGETAKTLDARDAEAGERTLWQRTATGMQSFTTVTFEDVPVDSDCAERLENCEAIKALRKRATPSLSYPPGGYNPSAAYCEAVGGDSFVLYHDAEGRREVQYCRFGDGSWISSWYLYAKAFPPVVAKDIPLTPNAPRSTP